MQRLLADRLRDLRLSDGLTQATLASRAGVTLASLRRFERTGEGSLKLVLAVAFALGRIDEFETILRPPPAASIDELDSRLARPTRKRGSR